MKKSVTLFSFSMILVLIYDEAYHERMNPELPKLQLYNKHSYKFGIPGNVT